NHPRALEIDVEFARCFLEKERLRLAAFARAIPFELRLGMMEADVILRDLDPRTRQLLHHARVHLFEIFERTLSFRITRLIRDHEEQPTGARRLLQRLRDVLAHRQIAKMPRRLPLAVRRIEDEIVEDAVAIEEERTIHVTSASRIAMCRTIVVSCSSTRQK